ncbi:MAG: DUF3224 domain-containing protein [Candidatus Limnocylindria bacterium]
MKARVEATFDITGWDDQPYDEQDGVKLSRTRVTKIFHGGIEGESTAELLMAFGHDGSAAYVGFERISGRIDGRPGSFVLHHNATASAGTQSADWTVVPGSGTGELVGLRGTARIAGDSKTGHTFTLDYEVP